QAGVEAFDYLTDDPSRLIVDFYKKTEPEKQVADAAPAAPATAAKAKGKKHAAGKIKGNQAYKDVPAGDRKPAGHEFLKLEKASPEDVSLHFGIYDAGDDNYDRFRIKDYEIREDAVIASRGNIYLPFPMLKMNISQLDKLMEQQPEYVIHAKDSRENKEAR